MRTRSRAVRGQDGTCHMVVTTLPQCFTGLVWSGCEAEAFGVWFLHLRSAAGHFLFDPIQARSDTTTDANEDALHVTSPKTGSSELLCDIEQSVACHLYAIFTGRTNCEPELPIEKDVHAKIAGTPTSQLSQAIEKVVVARRPPESAELIEDALIIVALPLITFCVGDHRSA